MTLEYLFNQAILAKKKLREYLGRAGKPWTEQEVKLAYLNEAPRIAPSTNPL